MVVVGVKIGILSITLLALTISCSDPSRFNVVLLTDAREVTPFDSVEVRWTKADGVAQQAESVVERDADYHQGVKVAYFNGELEVGDKIRVSLVSRGEVQDSREVLVARPSHVFELALSAGCDDNACQLGTSCLGHQCVDDACTTGNQIECPATECVQDETCGNTNECAEAYCFAQLCHSRVSDSLCGSGAFCNPEVGCIETIASCGNTKVDVDLGEVCDSQLERCNASGSACISCGQACNQIETTRDFEPCSRETRSADEVIQEQRQVDSRGNITYQALVIDDSMTVITRKFDENSRLLSEVESSPKGNLYRAWTHDQLGREISFTEVYAGGLEKNIFSTYDDTRLSSRDTFYQGQHRRERYEYNLAGRKKSYKKYFVTIHGEERLLHQETFFYSPLGQLERKQMDEDGDGVWESTELWHYSKSGIELSYSRLGGIGIAFERTREAYPVGYSTTEIDYINRVRTERVFVDSQEIQSRQDVGLDDIWNEQTLTAYNAVGDIMSQHTTKMSDGSLVWAMERIYDRRFNMTRELIDADGDSIFESREIRHFDDYGQAVYRERFVDGESIFFEQSNYQCIYNTIPPL